MSYFHFKLKQLGLTTSTPKEILKEALWLDNPYIQQEAIGLCLTMISESLKMKGCGSAEVRKYIAEIYKFEEFQEVRRRVYWTKGEAG